MIRIKKLKGYALIIMCLGAVATVIFWRVRQTSAQHQTHERVRLGIALQPTSALLIIAQEKNYFQEEGVDAQPTYYPSGKRALLNGLHMEAVDIISAADIPVILNSFGQKEHQIIATIGEANSIQRIIARRDRGIEKPGDLQGKVIGTQRGSAVHYYLSSFLLHNSIKQDDVTIRFYQAEELPGALEKGEIDAFSMREPYISEAAEKLGANAVIFCPRNIFLSNEFLVSSKKFAQRHQTISRMITALKKAEDYARAQPGPAITIVAKRLGTDDASLKEIWNDLELSLSLKQAMLVSIESQARWAVTQKIVNAEQIPNLLDYIQSQSLTDVFPGKVSIIR